MFNVFKVRYAAEYTVTIAAEYLNPRERYSHFRKSKRAAAATFDCKKSVFLTYRIDSNWNRVCAVETLLELLFHAGIIIILVNPR